MGMTTGRTKAMEAALDVAAVVADMDAVLAEILAAADADAAADVADDNLYEQARLLIGQVPLMSGAVDKDSFAIRATRMLEAAMRKDFSRIAGDGVRRRIMPAHARIRAAQERLRELARRIEER